MILGTAGERQVRENGPGHLMTDERQVWENGPVHGCGRMVLGTSWHR